MAEVNLKPFGAWLKEADPILADRITTVDVALIVGAIDRWSGELIEAVNEALQRAEEER